MMGKKRKSRHPKKHSTEDSLNLHIDEKTKKGIRFGLIVIILIIVAVILSISFFGLKISFTVSDELNLILTPKYQSASVLHNEPVNIGFTIKNQNFVQCKSVCNFTLTSVRNNSDIFHETQELKHNEKVEKNFTLYAPVFGRGQDIYIYTVECRNLKSLICLTDGASRHQSSIVAVNYHLDNNEKHIKSVLKPELEEFFSQTKASIDLLEQAKIMALRLPDYVSEKEELIKKIEDSRAELENIKSQANALAFLWNEENYYALNSSFSRDNLTKAKALSLNVPIEEVLAALILWNNDLDLLLQIGGKQQEIAELYDFITNETSNVLALELLNANIASVIDNYEEITSGTNISQHKLNASLATSLQNIKELVSQAKKTKEEGLFLVDYSDARIATKSNFTAYSSNGTICGRLLQHIQNISKENDKSVRLREERYNWSLGNSTFSSDLAAIAKQIDEIALAKVRNIDGSSVIEEFNSSFNITLAEFYMLAVLDTIAEQEYANKNCAAFPSPINSSLIQEFLSIDFDVLAKEKKDVAIPAVNVDYKIELEENEERCCTFNECNPCLNSSQPSPIPILFIHGHAFNEKNTPEYTMNAFAKMQAMLQQEKIINFGELDIGYEDIGEGEWAKSNRSLSLRASYYYVSHYNLGSYDLAVQKSEGIENYAIRLKEIIDLVKYRTGAPKVIVIAHSMGGLVVREYGLLFGYESLDKVILINTPNHGITKKIGGFCYVLGSDKECNDLIEGSIFLSKLNSRTTPKDNHFYVIRSTGCKMENNSQGDGIVAEENAYLEGAVNTVVQGECTDKFQTDLHTAVLDPELHPETYSIIKEILFGKNE